MNQRALQKAHESNQPAVTGGSGADRGRGGERGKACVRPAGLWPCLCRRAPGPAGGLACPEPSAGPGLSGHSPAGYTASPSPFCSIRCPKITAEATSYVEQAIKIIFVASYQMAQVQTPKGISRGRTWAQGSLPPQSAEGSEGTGEQLRGNLLQVFCIIKCNFT